MAGSRHDRRREVDIKILPEMFAQQPDHLARSEREARLLATLNHPSIASMYGPHECPSTSSSSTSTGQAGIHFLAMELVEGEDLSERRLLGKMPIANALDEARDELQRALELNVGLNRASIQLYVAKTEWHLGNHAGARDYRERALAYINRTSPKHTYAVWAQERVDVVLGISEWALLRSRTLRAKRTRVLPLKSIKR